MAYLLAWTPGDTIPDSFTYGAFDTEAEALRYKAGHLSRLRSNGMGWTPADSEIEIIATTEDIRSHPPSADYFVAMYSKSAGQWSQGPYAYESDGNGGQRKYDWGERQGLR